MRASVCDCVADNTQYFLPGARSQALYGQVVVNVQMSSQRKALSPSQYRLIVALVASRSYHQELRRQGSLEVPGCSDDWYRILLIRNDRRTRLLREDGEVSGCQASAPVRIEE